MPRIFELVYDAAASGDLEQLRSLLKQHPEQRKELDSAFRAATANGHHKVAELLVLYSRDTWSMIRNLEDTPFREAGANGRLEILSLLLTQSAWNPADKNEMFESLDYYAFRLAAANGHLASVRLLWNWASDAQKLGMREQFWWAFQYAVKNVHRGVVIQLWEWADDAQKKALIGNPDTAKLLEANQKLLNLCWTTAPQGLDKDFTSFDTKSVGPAAMAMRIVMQTKAMGYDQVRQLIGDYLALRLIILNPTKFISGIFEPNLVREIFYWCSTTMSRKGVELVQGERQLSPESEEIVQQQLLSFVPPPEAMALVAFLLRYAALPAPSPRPVATHAAIAQATAMAID